jgi:citrate lyase beta subunit
MRKLNYIELGATLFVPATHKELESIVCKAKYPALKSLVIDFEDGIKEEEYALALKRIASLLPLMQGSRAFIFVRPRDTKGLEALLGLKAIENITGFILPKFSLGNAKEYLSLLQDTQHYIMPSIEGKELFNYAQLMELKELLLTNKQKILLVRFGLEDMLKQLGIRRKCDESIFDFAATNVALGNFIGIFKSSGFALSGGVYPCYKDDDGFRKDVIRDLKEGLFSKTIIHPNQIALSDELYKVTKEDFDEAVEILNTQKAIFSQNSKMAERQTMLPHAKEIILRAEIYGLR